MSTKTPIEWARDCDGSAASPAVGLVTLLSEVDPDAVLVPTSTGVEVVDAEGDTLGTGPNAAAAIVDAVKSAYRREREGRREQARAIAQFKIALRGLIGDDR